MVSIDLINLLQVKIAFLLAYFPTISFSGWLQAFINKRLGDDTAANEGFLTPDPAAHFDPFGFFILIFPWQLIGMDINFGFGKRIPISVDSIHGKFKELRVGLLLFSSSIAYCLSTVIFVLFFIFIGLFLLKIPAIDVYQNWAKALILLGQAIISLNMMLFVIYTVINVVNLILYLVSPDNFLRRNQIALFLMFLIVAIALTEPLQYFLYYLLGAIFG